MIGLGMKLDADGAWPDLGAKTEQGLVLTAVMIEIAGQAGGMVSGAPSVMLRIDHPDGRVTIAETSLALLLTAADALKARHGDPRDGRPDPSGPRAGRP